MPAICVNILWHSLDLQFSFFDDSKEVSKLNDVFAFNAFRTKKRMIMRKGDWCKRWTEGSQLIWIAQVLLTRLQTSCSSLALDLFQKKILLSPYDAAAVSKMYNISYFTIECIACNAPNFSIQFVST